jgi:hypothetical protein
VRFPCGMSAVQLQRQLGIAQYKTAFQILHKLDESWIGGRTRGEGRGVHHKVLVACAVEVRHRKPGTAQDKRRDGRYAGRFVLPSSPTEAESRLGDSLMALSSRGL